jgi:hypothetical protein
MTLAIHPVGKTLECPSLRHSSGASPDAIYTGTLELHHHADVDVLLVLTAVRNQTPLT